MREILRAALAQARYMQVPVSAAVNEAVKLTRTFKKASASGLVNAVLRKACNYDLETARFRNETQRLMVLGSAGQDVAEFLRTHYPEEALGILTHTADGGCTSLRANCLKMDAAALCEKLLESGVKSAQPGLVPGSVLAKFEGSPAEHPLFKEGCFHVEGQASQLAALCVEAKPGDTVIDLCAAPGGKTLLLAEEMQGQGALYSCDVAEHRVGLIRSAVERMGFAHVTALCNDATRPNPKLPAADKPPPECASTEKSSGKTQSKTRRNHFASQKPCAAGLFGGISAWVRCLCLNAAFNRANGYTSSELKLLYTRIVNFSIYGGDLPMVKNENENFAYTTYRIGGTTYKVKVVFNEGATETLEDKILRIVRNEILENGEKCDKMSVPQMSRPA